jgi:hypothetical protein
MLDWGLVVSAVSALGAVGAAIAALLIATMDRRERRRERDDADLAQARLVQVEVVQVGNEFDVRIHNCGDRAIIGAAVTNAWWFGHPEYTWCHSDPNHDREKIVKPDRDALSGGSVRISFLDAHRGSVPKHLSTDAYGVPCFEKFDHTPDAVIAFMDAN